MPGGASISMWEVLSFLRNTGHDVRIICNIAERKSVSGIPVHASRTSEAIQDAYLWADAVLVMRRAALQPLREYRAWRQAHGAPELCAIYFSHNLGQPFRYGYSESDINLVVFNTEWVRRETGWKGASMVLHPTIFPDQYRVTPGTNITQINLARKKGGELFWEIARRMPEHQFMAVTGKESDQVIPPESERPSNVRLTPFSNDPRKIYAQTRVLLIPSQSRSTTDLWASSAWTESYGRVGVEAAISGIPVVALEGPGISEALGDRAIYLTRNIDAWCDTIRMLSDPESWRSQSERARSINDVLDPLGDLQRFVEHLQGLVDARRSHTTDIKPIFDDIRYQRADEFTNKLTSSGSVPKVKATKTAQKRTDKVRSRDRGDGNFRFGAFLRAPLRLLSSRGDAVLIRRSHAFDEQWYRAKYPDVAAAKIDPLKHFLRYGAAEGRDPSPNFQTERYLKENPHVRRSGVNPLVHFITTSHPEPPKNDQ